MAKKHESEDAFMALARAQRGAEKPGASPGMVMTHPPVGPSKSVAELLADNAAEEFDSNTPASAPIPGPDTDEIPVSAIISSPYQVRHVDDNAIEELAQSIVDTNGLITPIVVRQLANGQYELVAGHTRYEAIKRLGRTSIPATVKQLSDSDAAKALAADNLTRKDLSDFEIFKQISILEANGFVKSNSETGRLLGRVRQDIIRYKSYAKLPAEIIDLLEKDRTLIGANCAQQLVDLLDKGDVTNYVVDGCKRLFDGLIKNQSALLLWIAQQSAVRSVRNEFRVSDSNGKVFGKVSITANGIKISGKGLDYAAIEELLRKGLPSCKSGVY